MKKNENPLHSKELERALQKKAKEELERKAMEKTRNEYNYNQYIKRKEKAEAKARRKLRMKHSIKPIIFLIVMLLLCLYAYSQETGMHISDIIINFISTFSNKLAL